MMLYVPGVDPEDLLGVPDRIAAVVGRVLVSVFGEQEVVLTVEVACRGHDHVTMQLDDFIEFAFELLHEEVDARSRTDVALA
ncbi:hypothetical protein EAH86_17665 [Pedococcus bigeumensis]|uniref:Uncharacterized protein n=1 Tax=Pedococcus bigeumensis TaxID=433644 RepID=A0A502CMM9_9MICO|nr:hypothetical protein EAH86_17665 [Pedococcus bigeumensis]